MYSVPYKGTGPLVHVYVQIRLLNVAVVYSVCVVAVHAGVSELE